MIEREKSKGKSSVRERGKEKNYGHRVYECEFDDDSMPLDECDKI